MSTRGARGLALLLAPVLWSACGGSRCPEGTYRDGPQCRPWRTDSGPPRDAGGGRRDSGPPVGVDAAAVDGSLDAAGPDASADASADGAVLDGAAGEGGTDAGPCGACPAERPLCALDRCVECTAVDTTRCPRGCDVAAGACLRDVCEPCFTDAQCGEGLLCAAESGDLPRCHWREDAPAPGPDGSCFANGRPFIE